MREDRVVFLKRQVAATEEEVRRRKKGRTLATSNNNPSRVSQQQKRKLTDDEAGGEKNKRIKQEEKEKEEEGKEEEEEEEIQALEKSPAPKTYRWVGGEVKLEEEKTPAIVDGGETRKRRKQDEKSQAEEKNCPATAKAFASFEIKEEPNENYRLAMKIIQEGLNHIKRDPRTSSHVIGAIKVLESEANEKSSGHNGFTEYFEYF